MSPVCKWNYTDCKTGLLLTGYLAHPAGLFCCCFFSLSLLPSVLWRCWFGGRKGIRPVKNFEWWSTGTVICLERDADLHMAQLMPLPLTVSCFSKIQIGFTFLVPAHLGSPGKRAVTRVCVCVFSFFVSKVNVNTPNIANRHLRVTAYFLYMLSWMSSSSSVTELTAVSIFRINLTEVSRRTATNCPFSMSRGPSSMRTGTPYTKQQQHASVYSLTE